MLLWRRGKMKDRMMKSIWDLRVISVVLDLDVEILPPVQTAVLLFYSPKYHYTR
jgi:hypothetical protein